MVICKSSLPPWRRYARRKSFDWAALDRLHERVSNPMGSAKSVVLTPQGKTKAQALLQTTFGK